MIPSNANTRLIYNCLQCDSFHPTSLYIYEGLIGICEWLCRNKNKCCKYIFVSSSFSSHLIVHLVTDRTHHHGPFYVSQCVLNYNATETSSPFFRVGSKQFGSCQTQTRRCIVETISIGFKCHVLNVTRKIICCAWSVHY